MAAPVTTFEFSPSARSSSKSKSTPEVVSSMAQLRVTSNKSGPISRQLGNRHPDGWTLAECLEIRIEELTKDVTGGLNPLGHCQALSGVHASQKLKVEIEEFRAE